VGGEADNICPCPPSLPPLPPKRKEKLNDYNTNQKTLAKYQKIWYNNIAIYTKHPER
jgi:hypothetical protein